MSESKSSTGLFSDTPDARREVIHVYVTREEKESFSRAAKASGLALSIWARLHLRSISMPGKAESPADGPG